MTTPQREAFGGAHESAHWSPHLWDRFRSSRAHVDRMWRAFGMSGRSQAVKAEPAYIEHSNPGEPPAVSPERRAEALEYERTTAEGDARSAAQYERDMRAAELDDLAADERDHQERERRIAELAETGRDWRERRETEIDGTPFEAGWSGSPTDTWAEVDECERLAAGEVSKLR